MAQINGTSGKDIYTVKQGDWFDALGGDDELTLEKGGTAQGGPGNDTITVPVGFSCMILQSDNNTVSFSGTNNRYNYSSTSGIYAIATAMCYASGSVLLTGDLQ